MDNTELKKLLKQGSILLTNKEYEKAKEFFNETLDSYPECAQAYIGLLMAQLKVNSFADLEKSDTPIDSLSYFRRALNFGDNAFKEKLNNILEKNRKNIETNKLKSKIDQSAKQQEKQETKKEESISDNSSVTQADEAVPPKVIATETITKDDINLPETSTESIEKPSDANTLKELETDTNTDISSNTENDVNNTKASKAKILTVLCIIAVLGLGYTGTRMIAKAPETNATTATNTSVTTENTQEEVEVTEIDFSKPMEFSIPDVSFSMIPCKKGSFIMGSPENELGRETNEQQHKVDITDSFFIGKYEVTQDLYFSVMKENPSRYKGSNKPVDSISWAMAKNFCTRLNKLTVKTRPANYIFDLPTEAQWEFACRGGTDSALYNGKNLTSSDDECENLSEIAWYCFNSIGSSHPVGQKQPNSLGLYDMSGNIAEWCNDAYVEPDIDKEAASKDSDVEITRISKGGSWLKLPSGCRSASRWCISENNGAICQGFRIVLVKK